MLSPIPVTSGQLPLRYEPCHRVNKNERARLAYHHRRAREAAA